MKKLLFSYSGEEGMKYHTIGEIVQGETVEMGDSVKVEDGTFLKSLHDVRYIEEDKNEEYEEVVIWNDVEEEGEGVGYIKV